MSLLRNFFVLNNKSFCNLLVTANAFISNCCYDFLSLPKHVWYYLSDKSCKIQQWIEKIEPLLHLCTTERNHEVSKYDYLMENRSSAKKWNGYKVVLHYDPIIPYNEKDLNNELNASWARISKLWMKEYKRTQKNNKQPSQLNIFPDFVSDADSGIQYPNVCKLLQILIATPFNTSCVERGYSFLQVVCALRCNHLKQEHMEILFLLTTLKLPVKIQKTMMVKLNKK